jgi:hypothetical protein
MATSMTRQILIVSLILVLGRCDGNPRAYLWYPGNRRLVIGAWQRTLDKVCYRYGENTYNPRRLQRGAWGLVNLLNEVEFTLPLIGGWGMHELETLAGF